MSSIISDEQKIVYLTFAKALAIEAGDIMLKYFGTQPDQRLKADETIVTVADEEINQMVIDRVRSAYPDHAIDGEEQSHDADSGYVWVCDPIDGTNPFAMELPVSVFSLALVIDGSPVIGVIYCPFVKKNLYAGAINLGSTLNDTVLQVSSADLVPSSRIVVDWWGQADYDIATPMTALLKETGVYGMSPGSATHSSALVAKGELVAIVAAHTKGKNVDFAAAKVIVEEAGGRVTDLFGNEQRYDQDINGAIASNGIVHDRLVAQLQKYLVDNKENV